MDKIQDEHAGKGGSYVKDADGKRVLQERTDHPVGAQFIATAVPAATTKTTQPKVKGASNA